MTYRFKSKITVASLFILLASILFYVYLLLPDKGSSKRDLEVCQIEETLSFEGVVTDYSGHGMKSTPILFQLDGKLITIPRYNSQIALWVGDSIKKIKGSHHYFIRHNNRVGKLYDTVFFQCP